MGFVGSKPEKEGLSLTMCVEEGLKVPRIVQPMQSFVWDFVEHVLVVCLTDGIRFPSGVLPVPGPPCFSGVANGIPAVPKVLRKYLKLRGEVTSVRSCLFQLPDRPAGQQCCPGRTALGSSHERLGKQHTLACHPVEGGCMKTLSTVGRSMWP